jgi:hypothetical protein
MPPKVPDGVFFCFSTWRAVIDFPVPKQDSPALIAEEPFHDFGDVPPVFLTKRLF